MICGRDIDKLTVESRFTIVRSFRSSNDPGGKSYENVCKELGIGQYMDHNEQKKVDRLWKEMYGISKLMMLHDDSEFNDLKVEIRGKYPFVITEQDQIITSIWIMDKKGFNYIVSLGPPPELRWSCWKLLFLECRSRNAQYEDQLCQINDSSTQIGLDVQRTLVTHKFFQQCNLGQKQLLRVLNAVAITFPKLGYCQGMNFLVGFLLLVSGCDERTAYDCFVEMLISPKYLFYYLYSPKLPLLHLMSYLAHELIKSTDKPVYDHLKDNMIPDSFWLTKMIMSLFLYVNPTQQCIRIWDYVISNGFMAILEIILAIVHQLREEILASDIEQIGSMFQGQLHKKEIEVESVILNARTKFKIRKSQISQLCKQFIGEEFNKEKKEELQFWDIFLDYGSNEVFAQRIKQYNEQNEL